jgi:hypothetical protein
VDPEQELAELRARVLHLEGLVERAVGDSGSRTSVGARPVDATTPDGFSRRRMLRNGLGLSAAAVAGVGALDALGSSAAAADGDPVLVSQTTSPTTPGSAPTRILNPSTSAHASVLFQVDNSTDSTLTLPSDTYAAIAATVAGHDDDPKNQSAILGMSEFGAGVDGRSDSFVGVAGSSPLGVGVHATSSAGTGVQATSTGGPAVTATSTSGKGLVATSDSGEAIHATSTSNIGVVGNGPFGIVGNGTGSGGGTGVGATGNVGVIAHGVETGVDASTADGIAIKAASTHGTAVQATGGTTAVLATSTSGPAVTGTSAQDSGVWGSATSLDHPGVLGSNPVGTGVTGSSQTGTGVSGVSADAAGVHAVSTTGIGAVLKGGSAAVRLVPQTGEGSPKDGTHQRGELRVDSRGKLWLCTKGGSPGTWRQLAFV